MISRFSKKRYNRARTMRRREFFRAAAGTGLVLGSGFVPTLENLYAFQERANLSHVEARYYKRLPDNEIECELCPRKCKLGDKERGYCGVRQNDGGTYYTLVYGKVCSMNPDPIEKKPFFHVLPGTNAFSIATAGCNVNCKFCQNWEISQARPEQVTAIDMTPQSVVEAAQNYRCPSIAYTYSEPTVFYEYMYDTALEARRQGIRNLVVSAGHINPEPLEALTKIVTAIKIDLKAFNQNFYTDYVRGELEPVLEAIKIIVKSKTWLEIVYLVIPTLNDSVDDIRKMARWIANELGLDVPLHFTRFHPMYLIKNLPPTPVSTLEKLRATALEEGLRFVYLGNVPGHEGENTYCPNCGKMLIKRIGVSTETNDLKRGTCPVCRTPIPGIWG
jgi:pyruvate formate lyase activating enzyme